MMENVLKNYHFGRFFGKNKGELEKKIEDVEDDFENLLKHRHF